MEFSYETLMHESSKNETVINGQILLSCSESRDRKDEIVNFFCQNKVQAEFSYLSVFVLFFVMLTFPILIVNLNIKSEGTRITNYDSRRYAIQSITFE